MNTKPSPTGAINEATIALRRNIQSRKRFDIFFSWLGGVLIVASLLVLLALVINLLSDGVGPLLQTHETKNDQSGFGRRELVGTLGKSGESWQLMLDPLTVVYAGKESELSKMIGTKVGLAGKLPRGTDVTFEATSVTPVTAGGSYDLVGVLANARTRARDGERTDVVQVIAEPIVLDTSALNPAILTSGQRVSVDMAARPKEMRATATSVVPLVRRNFFTSYPSRFPEEAGILSAWVGTLLIMFVTVLLAVPLGVMAGIYLEIYAPKNKLTALIEINIANLAGVPSIIWGLVALGFFVYILGFGRSVFTAGMTLGLLVLPIVIIATREAIRSIPATIREASIGLGATRWQTVRYHVIPYAMPGILTGSIIAMSRAIGETAPLVTIGALTFIAFLPPPPVSFQVAPAAQQEYNAKRQVSSNAVPPTPELKIQPFQWLRSEYTVMPIQLFQWVSRPQKEFHQNAAAAGIVLLFMTLGLNGAAIYLRYRLRKGIKW